MMRTLSLFLENTLSFCEAVNLRRCLALKISPLPLPQRKITTGWVRCASGRGANWPSPMSRSGWQTSSCLPAFLKRWTGLSRDSYSLIRCGMCPQTMRTRYRFLGNSLCPSCNKTLVWRYYVPSGAYSRNPLT